MGKKRGHDMKKELDIPPFGFKVRLKTLGKFIYLVPDEKTKECFLEKGIKERIIVTSNKEEINKFLPAVREEIYEWIDEINKKIKGNLIEDFIRKDKVEFL